jgi:hypothetical protein
MPRVGSLEIDQDLELELRQWSVQRVGWAVFLLILIAGLAGLLGGGPLGHAEASADPLTVGYERFARTRAATELEVHISPGAAPNGEVEIWLDRGYLDKVDIEVVLPQPSGMAAAADRIIFRFIVNDPAEPGEIIFDVQPSEPGRIEARLGLVDGPEVRFDQFIYP